MRAWSGGKKKQAHLLVILNSSLQPSLSLDDSSYLLHGVVDLLPLILDGSITSEEEVVGGT